MVTLPDNPPDFNPSTFAWSSRAGSQDVQTDDSFESFQRALTKLDPSDRDELVSFVFLLSGWFHREICWAVRRHSRAQDQEDLDHDVRLRLVNKLPGLIKKVKAQPELPGAYFRRAIYNALRDCQKRLSLFWRVFSFLPYQFSEPHCGTPEWEVLVDIMMLIDEHFKGKIKKALKLWATGTFASRAKLIERLGEDNTFYPKLREALETLKKLYEQGDD